MSDSLHSFPSLNDLHLTNMKIHRLEQTVPHINLKTLSIGGIWEVSHPWADATTDTTMIAEWFPNLTHLILDCDLRISTRPRVIVLHRVQSLSIRSSAITEIRELTSRIQFPKLVMITNISKNIKGLVPIAQEWGKRVETLELSGIIPYYGSNQHLYKILGNHGTLPRLSRLVFPSTIQMGMIDLALVTNVLVRRIDLAASDPGQFDPVKTVTLPTTYKSDPNLEHLKRHVAVQWQ